jgi:hypothetical protein
VVVLQGLEVSCWSSARPGVVGQVCGLDPIFSGFGQATL